jgi:diguanylate cyclase (GGDEF)-like protein/PAS domain S-box-containing protein
MSQIVLLIQDSLSESKQLREALNNPDAGPLQVEWVNNLAAGLERLLPNPHPTQIKTRDIAAVLVDLFLPDSLGIETFDRIFRAAPQIPILILTAAEDEEVAKLAVQRGAQDYLLTDRIDAYLLPKTVRSMIERALVTEALFEEKERARVTLNSIGDAVICTDVTGMVTYLNTAGEALTGWSRDEATGCPVETVLRIVESGTQETAPNPSAVAIGEDKTASLTANCLLIRRDGTEVAIEDSAAPIHDHRGQVIGAVVVFHDVSSAHALALRMSHLAQHDSLTDLPNRTLLNDRLVQAIILAQRHRRRLAVLFLDVDRFKHINDSLGHLIGDRLLQSLGQRLLNSVRSSDTVSRQGGDEFVILLSELTHAADAAVIAAKLLVALSTPHRIDHHELQVTVSIGIANYPDDGIDAEALMQRADFAMYHAKDSGRNNYQFFEPMMNARAVERQALENDLRHALERGEFVLHYQPKMNLESGAITAIEALVRWHHPQRGLMLPAQFIPIAEECGFIAAIGRWVLREACQQEKLWENAGLPATRIAINVSSVELRAKDFLGGVRNILRETGLRPSHLELELTESFLMQDTASTAAVLRAINELGVRLALDDFGTGYSSLSHLKRFPIDTLKIDRSFVRDVNTHADDASIVSAVIGMGKSLHMRVVAEGVETPQQLAFLREHSCPEGQGHYFSRPLIAREFTPFLASCVAEPMSGPSWYDEPSSASY